MVSTLSAALARHLGELAALDQPAYYLAYQVIEREVLVLGASSGALNVSRGERTRTLEIDLRVGTEELDNTHPASDEPAPSSYVGNYTLPLRAATAESSVALNNAIWLATNAEYDRARADWLRARAQASAAEDGTSSLDFSSAAPRRSWHAPAPSIEQELQRDSAARRRLEGLVEQLAGIAYGFPEILESEVSLQLHSELRTLVNSEGSQLQSAAQSVRLDLVASTIAADGMRLTRVKSVYAPSLTELPPAPALIRAYHAVFDAVRRLERAPVIEPYVGPALLDGRAAGVFFHEVFGHRVEGHRLKSDVDGQTFANKLGHRITFPGLDVYDDPRLSRLAGIPLSGHYFFDDEGVAAESTTLVEAGVLRNFLFSRAPALGFVSSNGHGRREPGHRPVARQSNLVVQPRSGSSAAELRQALLREIARQGLPFGLRFEEIEGGYTQTQRYDTQAFKVMPTMVYRVFPDGREELVRGGDIEGTPLAALSKIMMVGRDLEVFNGVCGAESGWLPVAAVSPGMLVSQLEVTRKELDSEERPLLEAPR